MKNCNVVNAFLAGRTATSSNGNLSTDGNKLFSYNTCIAQHYPPYVVANSTKYSCTSSRHLYYVKKCAPLWTTKPVPRNAHSLLEYLQLLIDVNIDYI